MTTKTDMIRLTKAMQTNSLAQRAALQGMVTQLDELGEPDGPPGLLQEVLDAQQTIQNHIDALQHIVDGLKG